MTAFELGSETDPREVVLFVTKRVVPVNVIIQVSTLPETARYTSRATERTKKADYLKGLSG